MTDQSKKFTHENFAFYIFNDVVNKAIPQTEFNKGDDLQTILETFYRAQVYFRSSTAINDRDNV